MRRARLCVPLALLVSLTALGGCRSGTALHSRYSNFRAFYNTYYNAERKLEEGEQQLDRDDQVIDRTRLVELFPQASGQSGRSGPFQEAIDKSAELLRDRPESKWADDALLLIGKAYFYQGNVVGAEQKFREAAAAAEARDEPRLAAEATFWLGRTLAAAERFEEGVAVLSEATERLAADRRGRAQLTLALGELYAREGRWDPAAEALRDGAAGTSDRDLSARGYLLLGQVEENAGRWDAASDAYREADSRAGAYELRYAAQVSRALVLGIDAGRADEALPLVRSMRRDDKNYPRRAEVELVYARLLAAAGEPDEANDRFRAVLYDPALAGRTLGGEAHYRYGEFFRDTRDDYVRAAAHFDSAATSLRGRSLQPGERAARAAVLDAPATAQTFSGIAETLNAIAETDSLLALGALSDEDFDARIAAIQAERVRVFREEQRRNSRLQDQQAFSGGGIRTEGGGLGGNARLPGAGTAGSAEIGFLGFRDPTTVQTSRIAFVQVWGDRPRVPNWRRRAAIEASAIATGIGGQGELGLGPADDQAGLDPIDLSPIPRTPDQRNEKIVELAGLRYQLGNAYFLSVGQTERAAALYRQILTDTPDAPVAVRARYALAEIESAAGREDAANALYREVAESSEVPALTRAARIRLGEISAEPDLEAPPATSDAYDRLRAQWTDGDALGAAAAFVAQADADPEAEGAPRLYLAGGTAYAEWIRDGGGDFLDPLPEALRSTVLFPDSLLTPTAAPAPPNDAASEDSPPEDSAPEDSGQEDGVPDEASDETSAVPVDGEPDDTVGVVETDVEASVEEDATPPDDAQTPGAALVREAARQSAPAPVAPAPVGDDALVSGPPAVQPRSMAADSLDAELAGPTPDEGTVLRLADYFGAVAARYPGTASAERAGALRVLLPQPEAPVDTTATEAEPEPEPYADEPLYGYLGERPIDPVLGGFAWRLERANSQLAAAATVGAYASLGYRSRALLDPSGALYVVVGQFETEREAEGTIEFGPEGIDIGAITVVDLADFSTSAAPAAPAAPQEAGTDEAGTDEAGTPTAEDDGGTFDGDPTVEDLRGEDPLEVEDVREEDDASPVEEEPLGQEPTEDASPASGLRGDAPVDPAAGGFTWALREGSLADLLTQAALFRRSGIRALALPLGDAARLVVGQFETEADARAAAGALPRLDDAGEPELMPLGIAPLDAEGL